jgi:hypothetical protein
MKYRIIAACVLLAILAIGIFLHANDQPAQSSPGPSAPASKEDDAMKNLKL